jgi:hypothetical protein
VQQSIETQLEQARENRERYAVQVFHNNKIKANPSRVALKLYHHWDGKLKEAQLALSKQVSKARRAQTIAMMQAAGYTDGMIVHHYPTGVTGKLMLDDYGYMVLRPTDGVQTSYNRSVALYEHSLKDLKAVQQ